MTFSHISRKNLAAVLLSTLIILPAVLGGCKRKTDQDSSNKIVVWHWMSDRQAALDELAKRYEEKTAVKVVFELYAPSEVYAQKVRAGAQSKTLPDIYGVLAETRDFASFIKAGHVQNLSASMEESSSAWKNFFYPKALASNTFSKDNVYDVAPGIYGVPVDMTNIQMLYNKKLFAQVGLDPQKPPKTWKDFVAVARKMNAANIPVFVSGWGELWMIDCFTSVYAIHVMGLEKYLNTLRGEVPYTDSDWVKVLSLYEEMRKEKIVMEGAISMVNKTAEQNFANERAAFTLNGSWCVNVYSGMNPSLDYAAMLPPKVDSKKAMMIWGGAGSSFVINANSLKKDKAIEFLKWLTAKDQQVYLSETTKNLPANKDASSGLSPILASFSATMNDITHPSQWPVQEKSPVTEALTKGIQSILTGEQSAKQVAEVVEKVKKQEMSAK